MEPETAVDHAPVSEGVLATPVPPSPPKYHLSSSFEYATGTLARQAELRATQVPPLTRHIMSQLARGFPGVEFTVQLYGSLHHGLYVPHMSKIGLDISPSLAGAPPPPHVLHVLAALLQQSVHECPFLTYPLLVWSHTVDRPLVVSLFWNGLHVNVTYRHPSAIAVSDFMACTMATNTYMRLTLLHWKAHLRQNSRPLLGANVGQVSTYALFTILLLNANRLVSASSLLEYEKRARELVCITMHLLPGIARTPDMLHNRVDLTAHAHHAPAVARALAAAPPM